MIMKKKLYAVLILVILFVFMKSCALYHFRRDYHNANNLIHDTGYMQTKPFLKAHLKNGEVYILTESWRIDSTRNMIVGSGSKYNYRRNKVYDGAVNIPIDSVVIFETNTKIVKHESGRIAALSILAAADILLGVICLTNPKACFGSCPTFYIDEHDSFHYADAEAFSEAIRPSTEYSDIDALNNKNLFSGTFSLTMKNEALETHCVREVKLLAYPRKEGERIFHAPGDDFYRCENEYPLSFATADEGDITRFLRYPDREERFSLSDENNLSSKEEIYLRFETSGISDNPGLLLHFRQTLMTTYLVYSAFGYMGDQIGDVITQMESNSKTRDKVKEGIKKELGKIDVYLWNDRKKEWEFQNGFYEIGPIAINRQLIPLRDWSGNPDARLKLVLNRGYWRLDYAALTDIRENVDPIPISPSAVLNKGLPDEKALRDVLDPERHLVSMPGDEYKFIFPLPEEETDYELFLCSRGYYLEWMRESWIKDTNLLKLWEMVEFPKRYLREEAKQFKRYETTMEQQFWDSRLDTKTFVYHEN